MKIAAITLQSAADVRVRKYHAEDLAPFAADWIATLAPDVSGRLVVDAEDGGPRVVFEVCRGPGFSEATDRILRSFTAVDAAARELLTLTDGVTGKRLTCSLVLPHAAKGPDTDAQALALAALFGMSGRRARSAPDAFPAVAQVILSERPCIVTVRLQSHPTHLRVVGVADDVALCLGAAMLSRGPDAGASAGARSPRPSSNRQRIGRKWLRKGRRERAA